MTMTAPEKYYARPFMLISNFNTMYILMIRNVDLHYDHMCPYPPSSL